MTGPRAPLSFHPIAELGLSPWGVRTHFEKVEKQPSEFFNSGLVDILGQIVDCVWLRAVLCVIEYLAVPLASTH